LAVRNNMKVNTHAIDRGAPGPRPSAPRVAGRPRALKLEIEDLGGRRARRAIVSLIQFEQLNSAQQQRAPFPFNIQFL
jgi:hypothetical protein